MSQIQTRSQDLENNAVEFVPFGEKIPIKISIGMVKRQLCKPTKQGHLPSTETVMNYLMMARSMGLNPFVRDCFLVGYDGKDGAEFSIITAHQAFLKRAERHEEYDGMESGVIVKAANGDVLDREGDFTLEGDAILGGWAIVFFKHRRHPCKRRLNLKVRSKDNNFWRTDPAGMIVKCAEADALRSSFPTLLGGLMIEEEIRAPEMHEISEPTPGRFDLRTPAISSKTNGPAAKGDLAPGEIPNTPEPTKEPPSKLKESVIAKIQTEAKKAGINAEQLADMVHRITGRRQIEDAGPEKLEEVLYSIVGDPEPKFGD